MKAILTIAIAGLTGCSVVSSDNSKPAASAEIESAIISGIYASPIQLARGRYEGEPFVPGGASRPTVTLLPAPRALADVDGGGDLEWLVVLAESSGGSGTFVYLTVLKQDRDVFRSHATVPLGDRVRITRMSVEGATVSIDLLETGEDDPACCPTEPRTRRWVWVENDLRPVSRLAGSLLYGHEAREFVACGGRRYWVTDDTGGDLQQTYEAKIAVPYQPLFAEIDAIRLPAPDAAFAAPYDEQLLVTKLERLETEGPGCGLDIGDAEYRVYGVEPFWHVDVVADSLQLTRLGEAPLTLTTTAREEEASSRTWHGEGNGETFNLTINDERCTDPMSGSVFAHTAELNLAGETLNGCALAPLQSDVD